MKGMEQPPVIEKEKVEEKPAKKILRTKTEFWADKDPRLVDVDYVDNVR